MLRLFFIVLFLTLACGPQQQKRTPPDSSREETRTPSRTSQPNITPTTQSPGVYNQNPASPGVNTKDSSGRTPLHDAAQFGNSAEVHNLISPRR